MSHAEATPESEWDTQFAINTKGTAFVCKTVFPHLERGGSIVNVAAGGALKDVPILTSSYSASKGAVISFTRTMAVEWARYRIRCNSVNPVVKTTLGDELRAKMSDEDRAVYRSQVEKVPLGGHGDIDSDLLRCSCSPSPTHRGSSRRRTSRSTEDWIPVADRKSTTTRAPSPGDVRAQPR